jgi:hypothetical protein
MELDYCCLMEFSPAELTKLVKIMIAQGWEPQGGIAVEPIPEYLMRNPEAPAGCFYQAMIRRLPK